MNKKILLVIFIGIAVGYIIAETFNFDNEAEWQAQSADTKREFMWNEIVKDNFQSGPIPGSYSGVKMALPEQLGGTSIRSTFELISDQFPAGRTKDLHPVGNMVKFRIEWTTAADKYTGAFKKADFGLARISSAVPLSRAINQPSMGLKFFRDGVQSGDIVVQWARLPNDNLNFFAKCHASTMATGPVLQFPASSQATLKKFLLPTNRHEYNGFALMADFEENGRKVPDSEINFPFNIVLIPTDEIVARCGAQEVIDSYVDGQRHYPCLEEIEPETKLFDIYAIADPFTDAELQANANGEIELIGSFITESEMRRSKFGDGQFQVTHVFYETDITKIQDNDRRKLWEDTGDDFFLDSGCDRYRPFIEQNFP